MYRRRKGRRRRRGWCGRLTLPAPRPSLKSRHHCEDERHLRQGAGPPGSTQVYNDGKVALELRVPIRFHSFFARGGQVSPILVRPVREQLEHDRIIRILAVRLKRRGEVVTNIGEDQTVPVRIGQVQIFPDLVLTSSDRGHKLLGTVEVETTESINHLEAMAQWAHLGRARVPFHLYVPAGSVDMARRLAAENAVNVAEIWSFHTIGDQTRFTMVHRAPSPESKRVAGAPKRAAKAAPARAKRAEGVKKRAMPEPRRKTATRSRGSAAARTVRSEKRK